MDRTSSWLLKGPLAVSLFGLALVHFECWALSYIDWPWSPDHDVFATLARSWDQGVLPYRDMESNNPPTTIYVYWLLGKAFGWGRTAPFFAFDAALIALLGGVMTFWSLRKFESSLPGVVGYLWILRYYLGLDYSMAGQRDWHASLSAAAAMMIAESVSGRGARWGSAALAGLAVATRPQAALFVPCFALLADPRPRSATPSWGRLAKKAAEWAVVFSLTMAAVYAPLIAAGVFGDFLHDFRRAAYSGLHQPLDASSFIQRVSSQVLRWEFLAIVGPAIILASKPGSARGRSAAAWVAAAAAATAYKAVSPRQHDYLDMPRFLFLAVNLGLVTGAILRSEANAPSVRLAALLMALGISPNASLYTRQLHADVSWTFATPSELARGGVPLIYDDGYTGHYESRDYRALLEHLRRTTGPEISLANALSYPLALTGPLARPSAFPAESLAWLMYVRPDDEGAFVDKLEATPDSVVIWIPSEFEESLPAQFRRLASSIRRLYEPASQVGPFEVWRRKR